MRRLTCPANVEVLGVNISANLQSEETNPILEKYGILNPEPNRWYPGHLLLDAFNEMLQLPNQPMNFVALGLEVGRLVPMPPTLPDPDIDQVLMVWNDLYQVLHRGGDVGAIRVEKADEKHYIVTLTDLYPDDFAYGILQGYARRFLPPKTKFSVFYDKEAPSRDVDGADTTILHLKWD